MSPMYTKSQLELLLAYAKKLGFQDDIDHWEAELEKLEKANES